MAVIIAITMTITIWVIIIIKALTLFIHSYYFCCISLVDINKETRVDNLLWLMPFLIL